MAEDEPDIFTIAIDADDYAEAAAGDVPSVDRTYQSEEDFARVKASYVAKHYDGNLQEELLKQVPAIRTGETGSIQLDKRQQQLVGYAMGELYYDREYAAILKLLDHIEAACQLDDKLIASMKRWRQRCIDRRR